MFKTINFILFAMLLMTARAHASVVTYTDKAAWENAVGSFTTLDFTGGQDGFFFPLDYYADLGVTFTGQQVAYFHSAGFQQDGEGIEATNLTLWAHFDEPQFAVGVDFPGQITFQLWRDGKWLYTSPTFFPPGIAGFAGLLSDEPFDAVFIYRAFTSDFVYLDDLHFASLPAPGALGLFGLVALALRRRRRSGGPV